MCSPANKVYLKLAIEEINTVLGVIQAAQLNGDRVSQRGLSKEDQTLFLIFLVLVFFNTVIYIITSWYIGFFRGHLRRRLSDYSVCENLCFAPCVLFGWLFGSLVAIVFPLWGVQVCTCLCGESKEERRIKEHAAVYYAKATRVHAWEDLILDMPIFFLTLYFSWDDVNGAAFALAFFSAGLFMYSAYILATVPPHKGWEKTDEEKEQEEIEEEMKALDEVAKKVALARKLREERRARKISTYRFRRIAGPIALVLALAGIIAFIFFPTGWLLGLVALSFMYGTGACLMAYGGKDPRIRPVFYVCSRCGYALPSNLKCSVCTRPTLQPHHQQQLSVRLGHSPHPSWGASPQQPPQVESGGFMQMPPPSPQPSPGPSGFQLTYAPEAVAVPPGKADVFRQFPPNPFFSAAGDQQVQPIAVAVSGSHTPSPNPSPNRSLHHPPREEPQWHSAQHPLATVVIEKDENK